MDDRDFHTGLVMNYIGPKEQTSSLIEVRIKVISILAGMLVGRWLK